MRKIECLLFIASFATLLSAGADRVASAEPLQGQVEARPPLTGSVERKVTTDSLQSQYAKEGLNNQPPLSGSAKQSSLTGGVEDHPPLQGGIEDNRRKPLEGTVRDSGGSLSGQTPSSAAVMKIFQFKKTDLRPVAPLPEPITQKEIEEARYRDSVDPAKMPLRTNLDSAPRAGSTNDAPRRSPLNADRGTEGPLPAPPRRAAIDRAPRRSSPDAPSLRSLTPEAPTDRAYPLSAAGDPPMRFADASERPTRRSFDTTAPPGRMPLQTEPELPPQRARMVPPPQPVAPLYQPNLYGIPNNDPVTARTLAPNYPPVNWSQHPDISEARRAKTKMMRAQPAPQRGDDAYPEPPSSKKKNKKSKEEVGGRPQVNPTPVLEAQADESLLWDIWYQHVNDLVCRELRTTMTKHNNPAGSNRVHITVWADHRLTVQITEPSNNRHFDDAIVEAYRALNGSAALEFPHGTRRKQNDYDTAHIQEVPAVTAAFESRTVRGDLETLVK